MTTRVLIGVDGSACSVEALRYAVRLVGPDSEITAITAWRWPTAAGGVMMSDDWDPRTDAEQVSRDALSAAFGADLPAHLHAEVVEGHPARILVERSADADLVVVGSRGHGGFSGLLLGSVSAAVAEHASAPVLVYHAKPGGAVER